MVCVFFFCDEGTARPLYGYDCVTQTSEGASAARPDTAPTYFRVLTRWGIESQTSNNTSKVWISALTTEATPDWVIL